MPNRGRKNPTDLRAASPQPADPPASLIHQSLTVNAGPLPAPEVLAQYSQVLENGSERIFQWIQGQTDHRHGLERFALERNARRADLGLYCATIVSLCFLGGACWTGLTGHDMVAAILGGSTMTGLVTVFIYGTSSQRTERIQKTRIMAGQDERRELPPGQ